MQQSLFEFFLYIAVTIVSFYSDLSCNFYIALVVLFWRDPFGIIAKIGNEKDFNFRVRSKENMVMFSYANAVPLSEGYVSSNLVPRVFVPYCAWLDDADQRERRPWVRGCVSSYVSLGVSLIRD